MKKSTFTIWERIVTLTVLGLAIACIWVMVKSMNFADYLENYYGN